MRCVERMILLDDRLYLEREEMKLAGLLLFKIYEPLNPLDFCESLNGKGRQAGASSQRVLLVRCCTLYDSREEYDRERQACIPKSFVRVEFLDPKSFFVWCLQVSKKILLVMYYEFQRETKDIANAVARCFAMRWVMSFCLCASSPEGSPSCSTLYYGCSRHCIIFFHPASIFWLEHGTLSSSQNSYLYY